MRFLWSVASLAGTLVVLLIGPRPAVAQHYSNCLDPTDTGTNATVIVPDTVDVALPPDTDLQAGDELALYTADNTCAGRSVWRVDGDPVTIAVAGPNSASGPEEASGYEVDEPLRLEVWDASQKREYEVGTALAFVSCEPDAPLCRDDGRYETGTILSLRRLGSSDRLPVELTAFTAVRTGHRVRLKWTTAQETNNAGFEVQHRSANAPQWTVLQFVDAAGSSSGPTDYRYTTSTLGPGRHAFRLRQVDEDGDTSLSEVVTIDRPLQSGFSLSGVRPQPVEHRGTVRLRVRRRQHVTVTLFNVLGQSVQTLLERDLAPTRRHTIPVRARGLPSGSYVLRVRGETFSATRRVTIVR